MSGVSAFSALTLLVGHYIQHVKIIAVALYCDNVVPGKDTEKQMIFRELSEIYHSTVEPLEALYQYNVLGINSFTGILNYFLI